MNQDSLGKLRMDSDLKRRPTSSLWWIFLGVAGITAAVIYFAIPRASDSVRSGLKSSGSGKQNAASTNPAPTAEGKGEAAVNGSAPLTPPPAGTGSRPTDSVLKVSGYIINRERIEISPRFLGVVRWIGVKKGDAVTNGQVVVLLDDAEFVARKRETDGRLARGRIAVEQAALDLRRAERLVLEQVEMGKLLDDARLALESARASVREIEGQVALIDTYLDWCVIRSPINGVVLEKLVDPNELVTPQSFGGTRGPSTALVSVGDPKDLQVEIDLNESDLSKVALGQRCRVSPEAYPDRFYEGIVAEVAPEANRQKGTLQIKVQVTNPDRFLTPELSAKVDFLGGKAAAGASK